MARFTTAALDRAVLLAAEAYAQARLARVVLRANRRQPTGARRPLRIATPRTGNEKFLWRKAFDHDPRFVVISDKIACKDWVAALDLGLEVAPVHWVGRDAAQIPPDLLARDVVIKANHGCGTNLFPRRDALRREAVVAEANGFLRIDHGRREHEWGYFGVDRRLFVEDNLEAAGAPLVEMKFYTFGRHVLRLVVIGDRFGEIAARRWKPGPDGEFAPSDEVTTVAPRLLEARLPATADRATGIASAIGSHFDHLRVDILTDGHRLWLGELTIYNLSGWFPDCGHLPDAPFARAWDLRRSWFARTPQAVPAAERYRAALVRRLDAEGAPPSS